MGKNLIIKGADFSQNAIPTEEWFEMILSQSFYGLTGGRISTSNYRLGAVNLLYLQNKKIIFKGLKGINEEKLPLYIEFVRYSNSVASEETFLNSSHSTFTNNSEGANTFYFDLIEEGYYGFSFANNPTQNQTQCLVIDYSPIYYKIQNLEN